MRRVDTAFESDGERCAAWLYEPDAPPPWPCVVMAHGLGATREGRLWAYAERVAAAGLAALVFDSRHFGAPEPAAKAAAAAPRGKALHYDAVHFDVYQGELFERVVRDQTAFLTEHLLAPTAAPAGHQA
jgi:dienelactone hydrolase